MFQENTFASIDHRKAFNSQPSALWTPVSKSRFDWRSTNFCARPNSLNPGLYDYIALSVPVAIRTPPRYSILTFDTGSAVCGCLARDYGPNGGCPGTAFYDPTVSSILSPTDYKLNISYVKGNAIGNMLQRPSRSPILSSPSSTLPMSIKAKRLTRVNLPTQGRYPWCFVRKFHTNVFRLWSGVSALPRVALQARYHFRPALPASGRGEVVYGGFNKSLLAGEITYTQVLQPMILTTQDNDLSRLVCTCYRFCSQPSERATRPSSIQQLSELFDRHWHH